MKNILIVFIAITLISCGSEGKYGKEVKRLGSAKDSLISIYQKLEGEVLELEDKIYEITYLEFQEQVDSLGELLSAATDTLIQQKLTEELEELQKDMNNAKQASITKLRKWLKERNEAFNVKINEIDKELADLEGKVTRITLVSSYQIELKKFEHYFEIYGSIESRQNVSVNLEAMGTINKINVRVGEKVSQGQPLAITDSKVLRNTIDEVRTSLDLAVTVYNKQEKLWKQEIGSELQYLEAKNRKESIEQKLNTLNAQLDKYTVKAPFAGIVDEIFYMQGEMGNTMVPLLRLVNLNDVYLVADVSEDYLGTVIPGVAVHASFPSLDLEYKSEINRSGTFIKASNRTFKVYVDIDNEEGKLKPNLIGILNIRDFEQDSATVVPSSAIQQDAAGNEFLYVLQKEGEHLIAVKTLIKTGMSYGKETLVTQGLGGTEEIVLKGARNIKDGQEVKI